MSTLPDPPIVRSLDWLYYAKNAGQKDPTPDLEYRATALSAALTVIPQADMTAGTVIRVATRFEQYLRSGE